MDEGTDGAMPSPRVFELEPPLLKTRLHVHFQLAPRSVTLDDLEQLEQ